MFLFVADVLFHVLQLAECRSDSHRIRLIQVRSPPLFVLSHGRTKVPEKYHNCAAEVPLPANKTRVSIRRARAW